VRVGGRLPWAAEVQRHAVLDLLRGDWAPLVDTDRRWQAMLPSSLLKRIDDLYGSRPLRIFPDLFVLFFDTISISARLPLTPAVEFFQQYRYCN
jgi:hypothetical protein